MDDRPSSPRLRRAFRKVGADMVAGLAPLKDAFARMFEGVGNKEFDEAKRFYNDKRNDPDEVEQGHVRAMKGFSIHQAVQWTKEHKAAARFRRKGETRKDALAEEIETALCELGRDARAADVLGQIKSKPDSVIQWTDDATIRWRDARGRDQETTRHRFENRVSEAKKKI
jgi:hypothetical protein